MLGVLFLIAVLDVVVAQNCTWITAQWGLGSPIAEGCLTFYNAGFVSACDSRVVDGSSRVQNSIVNDAHLLKSRCASFSRNILQWDVDWWTTQEKRLSKLSICQRISL